VKCRKARQLLSPYIDDELTPKEKAALEEHLASCEACRAELEELRAVSDVLGEIFRRLEPPPDLLQRTLNRIRELEAAGEIERLRRQERRARWRKVTVGVGLAAGIGLAALQIGRAGVGPVPQAPAPVVLAPGRGVNVEDPAPAPQVEAPAPAPQVAAEPRADGGGEAAAEAAPAPAPEREAARPQVAKAPVRVTAAPKSAGAGEGATAAPAAERLAEPTRPAGTAQLALASGTAGAEPKAFLAGTRHLRTTVLKLAVSDLEAAKSAVAQAAAKAQAGPPQELWASRQEELILRTVVPAPAYPAFAKEVLALGRELDWRRQTVDVTDEFNRKLAYYLALAEDPDPANRELAQAVRQHLEDLDRSSAERGAEVVQVWLIAR
jgi:anti-sigma factor RsiW